MGKDKTLKRLRHIKETLRQIRGTSQLPAAFVMNLNKIQGAIAKGKKIAIDILHELALLLVWRRINREITCASPTRLPPTSCVAPVKGYAGMKIHGVCINSRCGN